MRPSTVVVFDGQSLNNWPPSVINPMPVRALAGYNILPNVVAINATPYFTLALDQAARCLPLFKTARRSIVVLTGGTGDIASNLSAATVQETMRVYAQACRDAGCDWVIATTITRWSGATPPTAPQEVQRQALNALTMANAGNPAYWDAAVAWESDSRLADPDNATYYIDNIHWTAAGHQVAADMLRVVLIPAIAKVAG